MNDNVYYIGSDLKFLFEITGTGFDQDESAYTVELRCGGVSIILNQDDIITDSNDKHYLLVDTGGFGPGLLTATVEADVEDTDTPTDVRHEVTVVDLCYLRVKP